MAEILLKKELAQRAGVQPCTITYHFPKDHPAVINGRINVDHPDVQSYLQRRETEIKQTEPSPNSAQASEKPVFSVPAVPENAPKPQTPEELANLTLQEIVDRFGHIQGFKSYVSGLSELENLKLKNTKSQHQRGILIDKAREGRALFDILEGLFKKLVDEIPKIGIRRIISVVKRSSGDVELDAVKIYQDINSRALNACKNDILNRLEMTEEELMEAENVA